MNKRTVSVVAALSLSGALLAASPASAALIRTESAVTTTQVVVSPRMAERGYTSVQVGAPQQATRKVTVSPRVAERVGTDDRRIIPPQLAKPALL